jgi:hypothetical protein
VFSIDTFAQTSHRVFVIYFFPTTLTNPCSVGSPAT